MSDDLITFLAELYGPPKPDDRDRQIVAERMAKLDAIEGPRVGDWVIFADGTERRISHLWTNMEGFEDAAQTGLPGGGYYLGEGYVSFSGSLYRSIPLRTLTRREGTRPGWIWIFHHGWVQAHSGVDLACAFRVYTCSQEAPK